MTDDPNEKSPFPGLPTAPQFGSSPNVPAKGRPDVAHSGLPPSPSPQFGGSPGGLPTSPSPQFGGTPGGRPSSPSPQFGGQPTGPASRPGAGPGHMMPRPLPEPSMVAVWGPRALIAGVVLAVIYGLFGLFSSGLSVERVGPGPSAGGKVLVLLHGAGAPGDDLVALAEECSVAAPEVTFLMPEGPHRAYGGRVWAPRFSAPSREAYAVQLAKELEATHALIWEVIEDARADGVACGDIYVGGFSQGGGMAAEVVVRAPKDCTLGGAILMSGGGFNEVKLGSADRAPMRILVAHGRQDGVIGFPAGEAKARVFADAGHDVRMLAFDGAHHIPPEVRQAIVKFMRGEEVGTQVSTDR
jgi:phospholipase/carboxylesterase